MEKEENVKSLGENGMRTIVGFIEMVEEVQERFCIGQSSGRSIEWSSLTNTVGHANSDASEQIVLKERVRRELTQPE
jgi:hypothetical protein